MKAKLALVFILVGGSIVTAKGEEPLGVFSGRGLVKTPPDYISLSLSVHSQCQPTPREAQLATDAVVKKISDYLQTLKTEGDTHFKILIDGGFTSAYSRWFKDRELCRNTFQKITNITLHMAIRHDFDKVFSELQTKILSQFDQESAGGESEKSQTYVSINTPSPEITRQHRNLLEREALNLALQDAKANFKAAIKSCREHQWKVYGIREEAMIHQPVFPTLRYAGASSPAATQTEIAAPVRFDHIEIIKSLVVTFQFDGAECREP